MDCVVNLIHVVKINIDKCIGSQERPLPQPSFRGLPNTTPNQEWMDLCGHFLFLSHQHGRSRHISKKSLEHMTSSQSRSSPMESTKKGLPGSSLGRESDVNFARALLPQKHVSGSDGPRAQGPGSSPVHNPSSHGSVCGHRKKQQHPHVVFFFCHIFF